MDLSQKTKLTYVARLGLVGAVATLAVGSVAPALAENVDPLGGGGSGSSTSTSSTFEEDYANYVNNNTTSTDGDYERFDVEGNKTELQEVVENTQVADVSGTRNNFIVKGIATITGWLLNLLLAFFFLRLAVFDIAYLTLPFTRPYLADANEDGQGNALPQMGGGGTARKRSIGNLNWVSDAAIHAVKKGGGAAQAQGTAGLGGGGFGGGGFGGGGFGSPAEQEEEKKFSVFGYWFKESLKEIILLGIALACFTTTALISGGMTLGVLLIEFFFSLLGWLPSPSIIN